MDESGEQFVAYFLPTPETLSKRSQVSAIISSVSYEIKFRKHIIIVCLVWNCLPIWYVWSMYWSIHAHYNILCSSLKKEPNSLILSQISWFLSTLFICRRRFGIQVLLSKYTNELSIHTNIPRVQNQLREHSLRFQDKEEKIEYTELQEYEYVMAREYNWNVKNKASKGYEENYFFVVRDEGVFYNELETRVRLSKRRLRAGQQYSNSRLVVTHRSVHECFHVSAAKVEPISLTSHLIFFSSNHAFTRRIFVRPTLYSGLQNSKYRNFRP